MAFECAAGTLNIGTGAATTTYSVTGKTGTWKAVILFWSGRTETTDAAGEQDIIPGIGCATSSTSRWAVSGQADHSPTTMATDRYHTNVACVSVQGINGAMSGLADFSAFTADGFTLIIDDAFPAALEVSYLLLGGSDLTDVATGDFALSATAGDQSYTGETSFQPDFALFAVVGGSAIPAAEGDLNVSIGVATASAQYVCSMRSNDAVGTSVTFSYCRSGDIFANASSATPNLRYSFTSFLSTGFQLNGLTVIAATTWPMFFLALKGGSYKLGDFTTATDTNAFTEAHGMAAAPKGALFVSANRAASTANVCTVGLERSIGAFAGSTNTCQYVKDKEASSLADCFNAVSHDQCYYNADESATMVIEGEGHVNSFDSTNINLQMTDADNAANFVWYAAFGDTPLARAPLVIDSAVSRAAFY